VGHKKIKKIMRTFLKSILIVLIVTSCSQNKEKNRITISGYLPNFISKTIQFDLNDSIYSSVADKTGKFMIDIPLSNPQYIYVKELDRKLFLIPDDRLLIEMTDDKYLFSGGQSALINNYYTDWETYLYAVSDTSDSEKYYNQRPYDFLKSVDKWIEIWKKPLRELQENNSDLNKIFIEFENARLKYWMYSDLNDYKSNNEEIPDDFYQYLDKVNLNDPSLMQLDKYKYFLTSFVLMKNRRLEINDKIQETSKMLDIIQEYFKNETIRNEISKEIIRIQTSKLSVNDTLFERFKTICTDVLYVKEIENTYQNLKPLLKGNKAPDFEFIDLNGNKVCLNDFKGKYLLIDVWSTTCVPCIREIPYIENLKQEFKDKDIEFIAACFSGESAWKSTLAKHKLTEGQYRIEHGWNSNFRNDYLKSSGVPIYILINPQGLIIDARAPIPSEGLDKLINTLNL
jgi:thiol-disulfide isomerase/thioredoxin